jgi:hypothetical protein
MNAATVPGGRRLEIPISRALPYLVPFAVAATALLVTAPSVWLVLLTDGAWPVAALASAAGWGAWPARWLRSASWTTGQEFSVAIALGLGIVGTATLAMGVVGALGYLSGAALLALGVLAGLVRLATLARSGAPFEPTPTPHPTRRNVLFATLALLPLCVPLYVMAFGACLPPGVLWPEEANGYDVLEYHLQGPREWFDRGRIEFLPHNVYTSFPQQTEILYLLLMHLCRDAHAAAISSQLLHAAMGALAVFAIGAWLPAGWPRIFGVVLAGTTPWVAYLGCLAYVENTMLFFAAVAGGIVLTWYREAELATRSTALAGGLCAGLAAACKYTGLVFVAAALLIAFVLTLRPNSKTMSLHRFLAPIAACYLLGVTLGMSPWLARNAAFTGNPVYPFANSWFGGRAWSAEQAAQWSRGHALPPDQRGIVAWFRRGLDELYRGTAGGHNRYLFLSNFGWLTFALLPAAALAAFRRDPLGRMLLLWILLLLVAWISWTYIPARFAAILIAPTALLCARASRAPTPAAHLAGAQKPWIPAVCILLPALGSLLPLGLGFQSATTNWQRRIGISAADMVGRTDAFIANHPLNVMLPKDAHAWLVGDAAVFYIDRHIVYHTVFSRDPWIEFAAAADPSASVAWLRQHGVTHVVFNWTEIERLRKTYGFSERVTREWTADLRRAGLEPVTIPGETMEALPGLEILTVER